MKKLLFLILINGFGFTVSFSQENKSTLQLTTVSTDPDYGFQPTRKHAIKVGNVKNEYAFINALAGPNGEKIQAARIGSCCPFNSKRATFGKAFLDKWEITWPGQDKPLIIYLNPYDSEKPKCPFGLTIAGISTS